MLPRSALPPKWQFNGVNKTNGQNAGFMLNTDFEVFYNLTLDSNGQATCILDPLYGLSTRDASNDICPIAATFNQALDYSKV